MAKIRVESLTKIFGPHPEKALELLRKGATKDEIMEKSKHGVGVVDVSFEVEEGEILVVMGLSGSGKSTLIRHVNRLIEPTEGRVVVDGTDVMALNYKKLLQFRRKKFGMVFQNFGLFPHRSVLQNTVYGLEIQGLAKEKREEKAMEALQLVGLGGWEDSKPSQLSGGMQQRVGLARALTVDPDILLMDEAFSALDPLIRRDMQDELLALQDRVKKTILFITHDLDEALKLGDRIVLMKDGKVVQIGTGEDILTNPASRYVERFVEDVDVSKVLTVRRIMRKARAFGFLNDGPHVALRKMKEEADDYLYIVKSDFGLIGWISADDCIEAAKRGDKRIESIVQENKAVAGTEDTLNELFSLLADQQHPIPVVDADNKLVGIVGRGSMLSALADGVRSDSDQTSQPDEDNSVQDTPAPDRVAETE